jgi:2-isopropylmalate synthase
VNTTVLKRITDQIAWMCRTEKSKTSPFDNGVQEDDGGLYLTGHDDVNAVMKVASRLGYDLSEEDGARVYEAFRVIAEKKEKVGARELDAIVASAAMQVPPTYTLDSFVVTSGNTISASANLKLVKRGKSLSGVSLGDGPIDAAFLAIEQITGRHYELDDFQIQSVTEGREAMGQTVVKLRSEGKVYSGRGISTDIVGASILAYINALNKIVYEEETV